MLGLLLKVFCCAGSRKLFAPRPEIATSQPSFVLLFSRLAESGNSGCLTAASLMESGGYVNAGRLKCLSSYKSLN